MIGSEKFPALAKWTIPEALVCSYLVSIAAEASPP
jgi:hypothetical protein